MKKTNKEVILQLIILIFTITLLLYGMISGKINQFVHPRFRFGLWISILVLMLFAFSLLTDSKKGRHNINLQKYFIYIIPLIFALIFPPISTGKADIVLADNITSAKPDETNGRRENIASTEENINQSSDDNLTDDVENNSYTEESDESTSTDNTEYSDVSEYLKDTQGTQDSKDKKKLSDSSLTYDSNNVNGIYVISDAVYADWIMDIYDHPDDFLGKKYKYLAQVFSMDGLKENQFIAGRYFMVCCAADLVGYGVICNSDIRNKLKEDQWIYVTGTISKIKYEGTYVPIMKDAVISKAKAPKEEYIYYNNY
ncbi:TIGR03943 family putative permease subunit [Anaerocolumna sp. MB42-C2]|uniref:TIGR03943 family putative permease subunit n=1 Tax=Anaerocolumna sp. MB42-C2 TaxID=3070997 RepID=UPI0027DF1383|nr:TIGR03943 family protein [Anaerocolumna sp. MB42-C2]WMJ88027.1 TIGR03943 family protein [Anaerocolumna sp. MB42-C2]